MTASGGGYFFVPSITALGTVIAGTQPALSVDSLPITGWKV